MSAVLTCLSLALGLAPADAPRADVASAAPDPGSEATDASAPTDGDEAEPSALETAERLFRQGVAKYETFDFPGAIELWTQAYATVPRTVETTAVRTDLVYNLSQAHVKQYDEAGDVVHLRRAQRLLERYIAEYEKQHPDVDHDTELQDARRRLDEVERRIAEHVPIDDGVDAPSSAARPLVGAGIGALAGGVVGFGVMGGGMAMGNAAQADVLAADTVELEAVRISALRRGKTGNAIAIVGGVVGGALIVTGATLLGIGVRQAKRERVAMGVVPWLTATRTGATGPAGAAGPAGGVVWFGRF